LTVSDDEFRSVLGRFASGVTVVTAVSPDGKDQGMTVSAFCSVSLVPPLVLICIERNASAHATLTTTDAFVVNILSADQEQVARRFAVEGIDRFEGVAYTRAQNGIAVLGNVIGVVECRRTTLYAGGDHTIIVGQVEAARAENGKPLLYYRGGYSQPER
jgi:flavin reductase (DIM6/NTAB) family NADH-FMN oxidoreductase RutF